MNMYRTDDKRVALDMNKTGVLGFFGGCMPDTLISALGKGHTSNEFYLAFAGFHAEFSLWEYYKKQSLQTLGRKSDQVRVPIWIACSQSSAGFVNVAPAWLQHIQRAINDINYAAPGLNLYTVSDEAEAKVTIAGNAEKSCYTRGNILTNSTTRIYLYSGWNDKRRTSCHELLHALALGHEHQRSDRDSYVEVGSIDSQYRRIYDLRGITRFDPFSIMLYPEDDDRLRRSGDPVWLTKPYKELNREMSDLDKVTLNNLYRPCKGPAYSPSEGITGLLYCGRSFGVQYGGHNGYCGPTNGPNCPACRVLKTDRVVALWRKGKWQGWTGGVYCGRYFGVREEGHDGYCGPNNGPPCPECYNELLRRS